MRVKSTSQSISCLLVFFIFLTSLPLIAQPLSANRYRIDTLNHLILVNNVPAIPITRPFSLTLDQVYTLPDSVATLKRGVFYPVVRDSTAYSLMFTSMPFIDVNTQGHQVTLTPAVMTKVTVADTNGVTRTNWAALTIRGAYTSTLPKKPYRVVLYTDSTGKSTKDTSLFGMRTDSEWLLLAMYNEPLRVNNFTSHALWLKMHKLYYASQEPDAVPGIRTRYVDVFIDGVYNGIYLLTEPMDRKQLKLKKTKSNGGVRGELYKSVDWTGATLFSDVPSNNGTRDTWAGYELKYPNDTTFWSNLPSLVDFVVNSTDNQFSSKVSSRWQVDNLVDYFLFLNLIRASDNRGKNLYIARYKEDDPYLYIPWDLDGTFGYMWAGNRDEVTNDIMSNGLYNRLLQLNPASFKEKAKTRWFSLRTGLLSAETLKTTLLTNVQQLQNEGAYSRESRRWPVPAVGQELTYAQTWIDQRLAYLDTYFGGFPDVCSNPTAPLLTTMSTTLTQGQSVTLTVTNCAYTTVWNNGATGNILVVSPMASAVYSATCVQTTATNCQSLSSPILSISVVPTDSTIAVADLSVRQFSNLAVLPLENSIKITVALTNNGPAPARTVRLQNRLPPGLIFASSLESRPSVNTENNLVEMATDSIGAGETILFSYALQPTQHATFRNGVQVIASGTPDSNSQPGSGTGDGENDMALLSFRTNGSSTLVSESPNPYQRALPAVASNQPQPDTARVDLSLKLVSSTMQTMTAQQLSLTLVVQNQGGKAATGVVAGIQLPSGFSLISSPDFLASGNQLISDSLSIGVGETRRMFCTLQATTAGLKLITSQLLAANQPDADSTPNSDAKGEDDEDQLLIRVVK